MGDLITMTRSTVTPRGVIAAGASAEILFFTGVRYERMPDDQASPPTARRRRSEKSKKAAEALGITYHV